MPKGKGIQKHIIAIYVFINSWLLYETAVVIQLFFFKLFIIFNKETKTFVFFS